MVHVLANVTAIGNGTALLFLAAAGAGQGQPPLTCSNSSQDVAVSRVVICSEGTQSVWLLLAECCCYVLYCATFVRQQVQSRSITVTASHPPSS